jgi:UDP:flavonoid glycosyltransferase YjiC (YdhE family)
LITSGALKFEGISSDPSVMVTPTVNFAAVFPECRAIVHHGGAGTTAASLRSGIPTLVLWESADQPVWARQIKRLGVGTSRRFSKTTPNTLHDDLRKILLASCRARAREVAAKMTPPHLSVTMTANLLENFARDKGSSQNACSLH